MSLSLKLELKPNHKVIVTNLQTNELREVPLSFLQEKAYDSLTMLVQYKYYEVFINAERIWQIVKQSNIKAEVKPESLKLQLEADNNVLVTNQQTNESRQVTMRYIQKIANNSLDILVRYGHYEILINTKKIWDKVKQFNLENERLEEIIINQKFRDIMVNDRWMQITDYDRKMYNKAIASWADSYNSQPNQPSFDKFVFVPVAGGAIAGALTYSTMGGMGIAAGGTAFGVGALGLTALGSIGGLAAYGIGKAIS